MSTRLRLARSADGADLARIYRPVVTDSATSFEVEPPSGARMASRVETTLPTWPWLVATSDAGVVGYAYAGAHRPRPAYRWATETSVYVAETARGRGVGRQLCDALLELLGLQGYRVAIALVTLPSPASVGLHEALGFRHAGTLSRVGHKFDRWHDVGWWQRGLGIGDPTTRPEEIRSLDDLGSATVDAVLA